MIDIVNVFFLWLIMSSVKSIRHKLTPREQSVSAGLNGHDRFMNKFKRNLAEILADFETINGLLRGLLIDGSRTSFLLNSHYKGRKQKYRPLEL